MKSDFKLILTEPNGNYAIPDIIASDGFETNFSIADSADIGNRKDSISKDLTFPGTENNDRILNNIYSFNRESNAALPEKLFYNYSPIVGVRAILYENNLPLLAGTLRITDIKRDKKNGLFTYTGNINGNLYNIFGKLKDKLLSDLSGFSDSVQYTLQNIYDSWNYSEDKKFLFPMIDFGKGIIGGKTNFDLRNFRPAIYARQYIKNILASQGYTYKSNFIDSNIFKTAYIPFTDQEFQSTVIGNYLNVSGDGYSYPLIRTGAPTFYADDKIQQSRGATGLTFNNYPNKDLIDFNGSYALAITEANRPTINKSVAVFRITRVAQTSALFTLNHTFDYSSAIGTLRIMILQVVNGAVDLASPIAQKVYTPLGNYSKPFREEIQLVLPFDQYPKDYLFTVIVVADSRNNVDFNQNSLRLEFGLPQNVSGSTFQYSLGDYFPLTAALPKDYKAFDMLKSIFQICNLYSIPDPDNDRNLIIEPYDVFYNQCAQPNKYAYDWTKKIDNKTLHIKINTSLPKNYILNFKSDSDFYNATYKKTYNAGYGDRVISNPNGIADDKKIEVAFSATVIVRETGDDKILPSIYAGQITAKESFKSNLRILFNNGTVGCAAYNISIASGSGSSVTYDNKATGVSNYQQSHHDSQFLSLLFGLPQAVYYPVSQSVFAVPNLYDYFYKNQLTELNNENIFTLEVDANLNEFDISELDLRKPIFIFTDQGSAYFKIISIVYRNRNEVSALVLQKIVSI